MNHSTPYESFRYIISSFSGDKTAWLLERTVHMGFSRVFGVLFKTSRARCIFKFSSFQISEKQCGMFNKCCVKPTEGWGQYPIIKHINISAAIKTCTLSGTNKEDYKQPHLISGQEMLQISFFFLSTISRIFF